MCAASVWKDCSLLLPRGSVNEHVARRSEWFVAHARPSPQTAGLLIADNVGAPGRKRIRGIVRELVNRQARHVHIFGPYGVVSSGSTLALHELFD